MIMTSKSKRYCSVPQCNTYHDSRVVSLHYFPKDERLKKLWQLRLKIGKPITKYMNVCSKHFVREDFVTSAGSSKPKLKSGASPSQNLPTTSHSRVPLKNRRPLYKTSPVHTGLNNELNVNFMIDDDDDHHGLPEPPNVKEVKFVDASTQTFEELPYFLNNDRKFKSFTNVEPTVFDALEKCATNILTYNNENTKQLRLKIIIVLMKLKLNISFTCLAFLFNISLSSCSRYFFSIINVLAQAVKPAIYWPTREENLANMPKCFSNFKSTRVVLDCTEIPLQQCKCLTCRILSYSHYKGTHTVKILIGVTPSGLICYKSKAYGGRSSDKGIFNEAKIIDKLDPYEAIMVDKGFLIDKECEEHLVKLIRPPFLRKQQQLSKKDTDLTASIARARVHVERTIQRIKTFKICSDQIEWNMLSSVNDILTIVCALVNLSPPILSEDKF